MHRRLLVAVGAAALITVGSLPITALAAGPVGPSQRIDVSKIDPAFQPMMTDTERSVTVVLELAASPALRAGTTRAAQQAAASTLRTAQKSIASAVNRTCAKVTARYQYAYNGLRVRTTIGQLAKLAAIPGVVAVRPVRVHERTNVNGVPAIGAPATWEGAGATGDGVIIAVLDTGIDYTHANFGGSGDPADYTSNDSEVVEAGTFPTPKVIAGTDFVGDDYDASSSDPLDATPNPDDDPIDCHGHGSHVAGSAAGFGVLTDGSTYDGLYTTETIGDGSDFAVGPGVAPEAKLVAVRVFGCDGSSDVVVDALEWVALYNVEHVVGIDVINMSLGSPFGSNTDPDSVMTNNLVASGVVVVASAGNESAVPFITGSPGAATRAISVAALDANPTLPMTNINLPDDPDIAGINQNAFPGLPVAGELFVLDDDPGTAGVNEFLGCEATDYPAGVAGKIVAVKRGVCAFVQKGAYAEAAGAIGIIVINTDASAVGALPTFIGYNPEIFDIPMIGTDKTAQPTLIGAEGDAITLESSGAQANPAYNSITSFSSSGPRWGDNALKPDVAAPGASVVSTLVGSGWKGTTLSGTSMAAPMTAGAAALVIQGHPAWSPLKVKAALVNTADAASVVDYTPLRSGSGLIAVDLAATANVVATTGDGTASLSYGYVQTGRAWSKSKTITIWNDGPAAATYTLAASTSRVTLSRTSVTIPAGSSRSVTATARLSKAAVANLPTVDNYQTGDFTGLLAMSGAVTATPAGSIDGQHALRVPYLFVPRGVSNVVAERSKTKNWTSASGIRTGKLLLENTSGHDGWADVYALGTKDKAGDGVSGTDVAATGVQVLPTEALWLPDPDDRALFFAVNMHDRFSSASPHEVDVAVDTNGNGIADFFVIGFDAGALFAGAYSGEYASVILDTNDTVTNADDIIFSAWNANAPRNGSTMLLPVLASEIGLAAGDGSFTYWVAAFDGFTGAADETNVSQAFDAFNPAISTGNFKKVDAGSSAKIRVSFRRSADPRGWLVITMDDRNGVRQGNIVRTP
jgi:subtilisin family serine protease